MAIRLSTSASDFSARFDTLLAGKREASADVDAVVRDIIEDVKARGDAALLEYTKRFDRLDATSMAELAVTPREIEDALARIDARTLEALTLARDRIAAHHSRQMPGDDRYTDPIGVELGSRWTAIEAVGLYVPGGTASYPSSVLMNAVPAKVAGVVIVGFSRRCLRVLRKRLRVVHIVW